MNEERAKPVTHRVDTDDALATLDHAEMLALAGMFERWALTEEGIDGEQRTALIEWSSDYEAIAEFAGPGWVASGPADRESIVEFLARREVAAGR